MAERKAGRENNGQDKSDDHAVRGVQKNIVEHKWRREIRDEYLIDRLFILEANQTVENEVSDVDEDFSQLTNKFEGIDRQQMYRESDIDEATSTEPESGSEYVASNPDEEDSDSECD
ncbi:hypothetical protein ANCCAN_14811 [Ancylostoma caninum]|uniref:Uncharacterized protein n=1 Tax=Ancylostoma caninum TaxID=29170 RepID=A0A368G4B4_ANCCA|nr:hypothetical protein ANCCAN_14811 [Ancylostoma caninum]